MATATRICKVCGKEYPYCRTERRVAGLFRWQDVACSVEHGSIYLKDVLASRNEKPVYDLVEQSKDDSATDDSIKVETARKKRSRKASAKSANQ